MGVNQRPVHNFELYSPFSRLRGVMRSKKYASNAPTMKAFRVVPAHDLTHNAEPLASRWYWRLRPPKGA
jgi:hypothetical protein